MQPPRILSIGRDCDLLSTRNLVLRKAGYAVAGTTDLQRAVQLLRRVWFDMVILCHAIPKDQREEAVWEIKRVQPRTNVVALRSGGEALDAQVDGIVDSFNPENLLESIAEILKQPERAAA